MKRKEEKLAKPSQLYEKLYVGFGTIFDFMRDYTDSGDWIIPLTPEATSVFNNKDCSIDTRTIDEYAKEYDRRLLRIYRHQDDSIILKNPKLLGSDHGLLGKISLFMLGMDKIIKSIPFGIADKIAIAAQEKYDKWMEPEGCEYVNKVYIWLPCWKINSEDATMIILFGRIYLVIT